MKISNAEEKELIEWGVKFYELGFKAALDNIHLMNKFAMPSKTEAVRKYMHKILESDEFKNRVKCYK